MEKKARRFIYVFIHHGGTIMMDKRNINCAKLKELS